jgi:hypothetical protein
VEANPPSFAPVPIAAEDVPVLDAPVPMAIEFVFADDPVPKTIALVVAPATTSVAPPSSRFPVPDVIVPPTPSPRVILPVPVVIAP